MNKFGLLAFLTIFVSQVFAAEFENVPLPHHQSISTLLYERDIAPIYGPKGYLIKVLELNHLTEKQARRLPVGFMVKLPILSPDVAITSPTEQLTIDTKDEVGTEVAQPFVSPSPKNQRHSADASLGYYFYQGSSAGGAEFQSFGFTSEIQYRYERELSFADFEIRPYFGGYTVQKLQKDYLYNFGLNLQLSKKIHSSHLGLGFSYQNLFYIYGKDSSPGTLNTSVPGTYFVYKHRFMSFATQARLGMNLSTKKNQHEIGSSTFADLLFVYPLQKKLDLNLSTRGEKRNFDHESQSFFSFSLGLTKLF